MKVYSIKNIGFIILGSISLVLGAIGIFLPILPTTPFLLLSAFCYLRSSKRLYDWLTGHRVFGNYIYNYMTYKAVTRTTKIAALVFLWSTLILTSFLIKRAYITVLLLSIGAGVSIHLLSLKTMSQDSMQIAEPNPDEN